MTLYMRYPAIIQQGVCFDFRILGRRKNQRKEREKREEREVNERPKNIIRSTYKINFRSYAVIFI